MAQAVQGPLTVLDNHEAKYPNMTNQITNIRDLFKKK